MANTQTTVPLFVANTVLTAASQNISAGTGVPVFATTVTRDAAFGGSNKALAEGQLAYIEASNVVQYYDGAAWATVGPATASAILQVKSTALLTTFTTTSATFTGVTGLTIAITPSSASNKVLVVAQIAFGMSLGTGYGHFKLSGGNSGNYVGDSPGSRIAAVFGGYASADQQESVNMGTIVYLDSPATTSATTYGVSVRTASAGSVNINRAGADSNDSSKTRGASSITVMEVTA